MASDEYDGTQDWYEAIDNGVALRRGDVAGVTHWIEWDAIGRVRVRALCGAWVRRTDHRNVPTCPDCQRLLTRVDALRF